MKPASHKSFWENQLVATIVTILSAILFFYSWSEFTKAGNSPSETSRRLATTPEALPDTIASSGRHSHFGSARLGILKLGCVDPAFNALDTTAEAVRLSGRLCGKEAAGIVREVRVVHAGRKAALVGLYEPHDRLVSTEFFPLDAGENIVELELKFKNGKTLKTNFRITRRSRDTASK